MKKTAIIAAAILTIQCILLLLSSWNDSAIMDEVAHIPAGYSYVAKKDMRLNPEHPPLIKDIAGLPLLLLRPNFPTDTNSWQHDNNGQWVQGVKFLYESGNDANAILFWSRFPMILLALVLSWLIFSYTRRRYTDSVALLTLTFIAFSPTILAHARFVTTDIGATFGFFIGITGLIRFLENPSWKNALFAGFLFGVAQLMKFSLILLVPLYAAIILVWLVTERPYYRGIIRFPFFVLQVFGKTAILFFVGIATIWLVYAFHVINYPATSVEPGGKIWTPGELIEVISLPEPERTAKISEIPLSQMRDTVYVLSSFAGGPDPEGFVCDPKSDIGIKRRIRCLAEFTIWGTDKPLVRPISQYLLGIEMVLQRSAGGNTGYFLGEVSAAGWKYYFPVLYLLKEPTALLLLAAVAFLLALWRVLRGNKSLRFLIGWIHDNFFEFTSLFFIAFYWLYSVQSPLNIGIRHVLPTFPFIYILLSKEIHRWLTFREYASPDTWGEWLIAVYKKYIASIPKYIFVTAMLGWLVIDTFIAFPAYLSYYNEIAGTLSSPPLNLNIKTAIADGYQFAVDSNYDWGQDLKRLAEYAKDHRIQKIAVDYFGGGSPRYYLGDAFEPWWSSRGKPTGYFAVSATFLRGAYGTTAPGFERKPEDEYEWLKPFRPIARAGQSIFIYKLP